MPITIRLARPADAAELMRLNEDFNGPSGQSLAAMEDALREPGPEVVFVAESAGAEGLAGFCCCLVKHSFCYDVPSAEITEFFVDPACRRQGVGRALLAAALEHCRAGEIYEVTLLTGEDNYPAQSLYQGLGFRPTGELHMGLSE